MSWKVLSTGVLAAGMGLAGCGGDTAGDARSFDVLDGLRVVDGKADMVSKAHIIDDIPMGSVIKGTFQPRMRVHGFTFEAKAGADIQVSLKTRAGADSIDARPGAPLDTVAAIYGPIKGDDKGARLAASDDTDHGLEAELPGLRIEEDGRYLVIFSSWDDPGAGSYDIGIECEGTNFQCLRPVVDRPCTPGTRYIQGQTVIGDETWSRCEVVLLENTVVEADAILTIAPGVTVKGNFLGEGAFGSVGLQVDGQLQAVGTAQNPVVFTALRDGWKGLLLNGHDNNLSHVYIEKAAIGVDAVGGSNTIQDTVIDHGGTGVRFQAQSADNDMARVKIEAVRDGIIVLEGAQVDVVDAIIRGNGVEAGRGFSASHTTRTEVNRSVISGFQVGAWFEEADTYFHDTTLARNGVGVEVTGANPGVHPAFTCPAMPAATTPSRPAPSVPAWRPRDPAFFRCDIRDNDGDAIRVLASQLLVVEDSNIRGNGAGVIVRADSLHTDSRIQNSNIFENGEGLMQVDAWHINGTLDISGNYWAQISDPELSQSWDVDHSLSNTCAETRVNMNGCSWDGRVYTCGPYTCTRGAGSNWNCRAPDAVSRWTGNVEFTGFSPEELAVGPKLETLTAAVNAARVDLGLDAGQTEAPAPARTTLAITEIDYDQPGRDDKEFLELQNVGDATLPLTGCIVEFVNGGTDSVYMRYDLGDIAPALQPGQRLVLGARDLVRTLGADVVTGVLTAGIQNGSPDGVRVVYNGTLVDGLAYEGAMPGTGRGDSPTDRESNSGLNESLSRCGDTDDNAKDFRATLPTPGAANACN